MVYFRDDYPDFTTGYFNYKWINTKKHSKYVRKLLYSFYRPQNLTNY